MNDGRRSGAVFALCIAAAIVLSRLCHLTVLWSDEDYHLAAAIQMLHGKLPYRDFWYDKPPLNLIFYLLFGARTGLALRLADSAYLGLCCALAYKFAASLWTRREGFLAAAALAFFLIFYLPSAVLPLEPDTLMIAPHLAAVWLAWKGRPLAAGIAAGIAFQLSVKGVFVLASAACFAPAALPLLLLGFLIPNALVLALIAIAGAWPGYIDQVWRWGLLYAGPNLEAMRILDWLGFHAAMVIAAIWYWARSTERVPFIAWSALSLAAAAAGGRLAPRYFNQLLPALVIPAARGFTKSPRTLQIVAALALLVPAVRFGPRYLELARDDWRGAPHTWKDAAMDQESREAARIVTSIAQSGDTILIWGYRPDVIAYTRLPVAGRFWDSQPLTGVPADRHLSSSQPVDEAWARENRTQLIQMRPSILVDGLSLYNPALDIHGYPDLANWLKQYCPAGRTGATVIYRVCP